MENTPTIYESTPEGRRAISEALRPISDAFGAAFIAAFRPVIEETVAQCLGKAQPVQTPTPTQSDKFYTRNEVAAMFNINLSTLYHWTKDGIVTASKFGNRVYYRESDLQELFNQRRKIV